MAADWDGWTLDRYHAVRRLYRTLRRAHFSDRAQKRMMLLKTRIQIRNAYAGEAWWFA